MSPPEADPPCAHHARAPSIAICSECGAPICGECHGFDARGYALCPPCRGRPLAELPAWERPGGAYTPRSYLATLLQVIRSPRTFFEDVGPSGRWMPAAAFGFVSVLLGLLVDRIWKLTLDSSFEASLSEFAATRSMAPDELQWLVFLSVPISALLVTSVHTAALKVAGGIAGAPIGWRGAARFSGYALGAFVFLVVPPISGIEIGTLLAVFWLFNLEATAFEHAYEFSAWKATLTVLVPVLLALMCAG